VKDEKGKEATMTCSCENGVVRLQSLMPDRITVTKEERMLESRSVLRQTVDVLKNGKQYVPHSITRSLILFTIHMFCNDIDVCD
jgi:hypothetical protein